MLNDKIEKKKATQVNHGKPPNQQLDNEIGITKKTFLKKYEAQFLTNPMLKVEIVQKIN